METSVDGEGPRLTPINMGTGANRSKCGTNKNQDIGSSSTNAQMRVFHSPVRFCNVVKKIKNSQPHVDAIESIGFGGLLQMPSISLRKNMLKDIAEAYDISNRGFKLCGQIVSFPPDDVQNILGLQISGNDVMQHIKENKKSEDETVRSELFKRFASDNHKLELQGLENMIHKERPADHDFIRAFVLFTIGVLLASNTGPTIHWSYIEAVRDIAQIRHFNWGQFTLKHLLNSCTSFKNKSEKTLKGNLVLLQFWYWERVRVANHHAIEYDERTTQPPLMVFWNEENAKRRQTAWEKDGLDGGTLNLPLASNTKQKREATVSQAKQANEGPSNLEVQSLEQWKKTTKRELKLDLEKKLLELEHKQDIKFLDQKKEFASFANDSIQDDRYYKLEAKVFADYKQTRTEIQGIRELVCTLIDQCRSQGAQAKQHMPSAAQVQPPMCTPAHDQGNIHTRFHKVKDRIYAQSPIARNDTIVTTMEQHGNPPATHIKPREPIIDDDYNTGSIDREAAMFLINSYDKAVVVDIDGIRLKAGELHRNVSEQFISGEVINAFVHLSNVENDTTSFIHTFDAQKLSDPSWELNENDKKRIADKCIGKHLVFVPMNINGNHWGLLVLNFIKKEVQILESLGMRDEEREMTLVETIQCCFEFSFMKGLVNYEYPFDLREWEIVPYEDIPRQQNSFTCAAFVIQYILAWDGEKMCHEFTSEEMESFCFRICTRLLHSDRNKLRLESYEKPITEEAYLVQHPDEREHTDGDDLQIIRRPRGRPPKTRVGEGSAKVTGVKEGSTKVTGVEKGTAKVSGAANRKRSEPSRRTADTTPRTVLDEFRPEYIANRINKRKKIPGKLLGSPYQAK